MALVAYTIATATANEGVSIGGGKRVGDEESGVLYVRVGELMKF